MRITDRKTLAEGKFLRLEEIEYTDGHEVRKWEACQRAGGADAVSVFAIKPQVKTVVLVRQFRPPVGRFCIECPAGLVEKGESPRDAAIRELMEETGYIASRVADEGVAAENSAGLTGELTTPMVVFIDESVPRGPQRPDPGESIELLEIPLKDLPRFIRKATSDGDVVSGKLVAFSFGLRLSF